MSILGVSRKEMLGIISTDDFKYLIVECGKCEKEFCYEYDKKKIFWQDGDMENVITPDLFILKRKCENCAANNTLVISYLFNKLNNKIDNEFRQISYNDAGYNYEYKPNHKKLLKELKQNLIKSPTN